MAQLIFRNAKDGSLLAYYVVSKNRKKKWIPRGKVLNRKLAVREFKAWERTIDKERLFEPTQDTPTLEAYFPAYLQWAEGRTLSGRGVESAKNRAAHLLRLLGKTKLQDLHPSVIDGYVDRRKAEVNKYHRPPSPKTINNELTQLSSIVVCALKNDVLKVHPFKNDQRPLTSYFLKTSRKVPTVLSQEEIRLMLDAVKDSPHAYCVFLCFLLTGMRKSELTDLKWSGVDLPGRRLTFEAEKTDDYRTIPMPEALALLFERMKADYPAQKVWKPRTAAQMEYVFCYEDGGKLQRGLGAFLPRLAGKVGLTKRVTPHVLRHSFAAYGRSTLTSFQLQKLLGHRNITTTEKYGFVLDSAMKAGTENLAASMGIDVQEIAYIGRVKALPGRPGVDQENNAVKMPQKAFKNPRFFGESSGNRTRDTHIKSVVLYQLS